MDEITLSKKSRIDINFTRCIICQENKPKKKLVSPQLETLERLINLTKEREVYGDNTVREFNARMGHYRISDLLENKALYHKDCYALFGNTNLLERVKARYQSALQSSSSSVIKRMPGRPSSSVENDYAPSKGLRSQAIPYSRDLCVICQSVGGKTHNVEYMKTGVKMFEVAKELSDQGFYRRLNSIPDATDAVANDVKYHLRCWVNAQRKLKKSDIQELDNIAQVVSDIEITNIVECEINNSEHPVLNMSEINECYKALLRQNGEAEDLIKDNYKRYLKLLINQNISSAMFMKSPRVNEPERVCSKGVQEAALDILSNQSDDLDMIFKTAKLVRNELLQHPNWTFTGSFENFQQPQLLQSLIKWIIFGPRMHIKAGSKTEKSINKDVSVASYSVDYAVFTDESSVQLSTF